SAGLMKEGLIRQWRDLSPEDISLLRGYLLNYVVSHGSLSAYVRERIVQVLAIIVKRQSIQDQGEERGRILKEAQSFITTGNNMQMQMVGCSLLSSLLTEYATTLKSSDVGLPWEVTDLKAIFEFCLQALKELLSSSSSPIFSPEVKIYS
ncbi:Exportin 4, partial [Caligus rogercresseyi]